MSWSKVKQQLESFLTPALQGKVEYRATSYRYVPDKAGQCYITVDKKNILQMNDPGCPIRWYPSDQEIKQDGSIQIPITEAEIEALRAETQGKVPEERLRVMVRGRRINTLSKSLLAAQATLSKSSFIVVATTFLTTSIEDSLESQDILLNVLALVDRRVGKKRLLNMADQIKVKHPIVQYFYALRMNPR
ncbi:hypothetical protein PA598K_00826 [Paenibacillus sp. 598K]|uniref:SF0329 family protein n=1 Tax=Paenibacillus sp. 598K TaxID=1117987 RepID=UPI000FF9297F|nr:hypothetical protein [Paenibacillus sp. 598K]GBF72569.1 hypothetical protein PA598K_00826 [Paenibacillus sp. 598K]